SLAGDSGVLKEAAPPPPEPKPQTLAQTATEDFVPMEPESFREAKLTESEVESLILKLLLARGTVCGRDIADQIRLPFKLIDELLRQMKADQLVVYSGAAPMNDYEYRLT